MLIQVCSPLCVIKQTKQPFISLGIFNFIVNYYIELQFQVLFFYPNMYCVFYQNHLTLNI